MRHSTVIYGSLGMGFLARIAKVYNVQMGNQTMSTKLYLNMFTNPQTTRLERKRARRKKLIERLSKVTIYGGFIAGFSIGADNPFAYMSVVSSVCIALECFR